MNRSALRKQLLDARMALSTTDRGAWDHSIAEHLRGYLLSDDRPAGGGPRKLGAYWPIRNEPSLHNLLIELELLGFEIALPAIVANDKPLRFLHWHSERPLVSGPLGIPIPDHTLEFLPDLLLVPCLGFFVGDDGKRYRLGYGGGFYDRTLAARPIPAIGIAYESSRIGSPADASFGEGQLSPVAQDMPSPETSQLSYTAAEHDLPMTAIVTEAGVF